MVRVLLDGNVYDQLAADSRVRDRLAKLVKAGGVEIVATPVVVDELGKSHFGGLPDWFPITVEPEAVCVVGFARIGMARLSDGAVYEQHRGESRKFADAIIAESANAMADVLVSEDRRCRRRAAEASDRCRVMSYAKFSTWLDELECDGGPTRRCS